MTGTERLVTKGYCLALISEMNDEELEQAISALKRLIHIKAQDRKAEVRGMIEQFESRGAARTDANNPAPNPINERTKQ